MLSGGLVTLLPKLKTLLLANNDLRPQFFLGGGRVHVIYTWFVFQRCQHEDSNKTTRTFQPTKNGCWWIPTFQILQIKTSTLFAMFEYDSININIPWLFEGCFVPQAMEPWKQSPGPHCLWTLVIGKVCRSGGGILVRLSLSACRSSGMIVYKIRILCCWSFLFLGRNRYIKSISWNAPKTTNSHHKDSNVVADASFGCSTYFFCAATVVAVAVSIPKRHQLICNV